MYFRSWIPEEEETLAESDLPGFRRLIVQTAKDHGVVIHWEHSLISLEQGVDEVRVKFENGHTDVASFVIGCNGLHSNTRSAIFGREKADFTGLTQTAGESLTAKAYSGKFAMTNIYANGVSALSFPLMLIAALLQYNTAGRRGQRNMARNG